MANIYNPIIKRKRINRQLEYIFHYPLTVLHAPSGYGKTTAMQQFLKEKRIDFIWTNIVNNVGYTNYFWEKLTTKIEEKCPGLGQKMQTLGFPDDASTIARIINMINNKELKQPFIIVIDDYNMVKDLDLYNCINVIVQDRIKNLHIVVITRDLSMFDVADFYQKQLCYSLSQHILKFDNEEIKRYVNLISNNASDSTIKKISDFSNGWIALIYLLVKDMQKESSFSATRSINDLIEKNFYEKYDNHIKDFLLKISFLNSFTIAQANYILDISNTAQILKQLQEENAFIAYNEFSKVYKIHALFLNFLREKIQEENVDLTDLYNKCGKWFLKQNLHMQALDFFYKAGNTESILHLLNQESTAGIHFTQFAQVYHIFEGLDKELGFKYPLAYLRYIRIAALRANPKDLKECKQDLIEMEEYITNADLDKRYKAFILGEIHIVWGFVVFNDIKKMVSHCERALEFFDGGCSCIVTRNKEMSFGSPHLLYAYYKEQGGLQHITDFIANNIHKMSLVADSCGTGSDSLVLAEFALETGDFNNIELHAYKAIYKAQMYDQLSIEICAHFVLQRLTILKNYFQEGLEMATAMKAQVEKQNNPVLNTTFELCDAYIDCCLQRFENIPDWIKKGQFDSANFMYQGMAFVYIVYGKTILLSGNYLQLEALCETFDDHFSIYNNQLGFINNDILKAIAKYKLYGLTEGKKALIKALKRAQDDNVIMPFVENGTFILDILKEITAEDGLNKAYLAKISSYSKKYHEIIAKSKKDCLRLTSREKEILQMMEKGYKHEEISKSLFISVTTVRFHIKNIYQKLEVNNKILALKKAKNLNLL